MEVSSERYKKIFGDEFSPKTDLSVRSIRTNVIKMSPSEMKSRLVSEGYSFEEIPWLDGGFWVRSERILSKTMEHILGYFFLQDASSMIPPIVLDPKEGDVVLDISAAPGSKTTQMAGMMKNSGVIVANDVKYDRMKALRGNLQRCGVMNTIVTKQRGENFWKSGIKFDKILVDAPCTGTGTMNPRILKETSERTIRRFSEEQKRILYSASKCLNDGGNIVYSTCSLEPEENELIVDFAVRELGLKIEKADIDLPKKDSVNPVTEWNGKSVDSSVSKSIRIVPTANKEGFFVCRLKL